MEFVAGPLRFGFAHALLALIAGYRVWNYDSSSTTCPASCPPCPQVTCGSLTCSGPVTQSPTGEASVGPPLTGLVVGAILAFVAAFAWLQRGLVAGAAPHLAIDSPPEEPAALAPVVAVPPPAPVTRVVAVTPSTRRLGQ